jgi:hypothetical protein
MVRVRQPEEALDSASVLVQVPESVVAWASGLAVEAELLACLMSERVPAP